MFKLSPNPSNNLVTLFMNLPKSNSGNIIIRDQLGRVVKQLNKQNWVAGSNQQIINVSMFNPGVYFISMQAEGITATEKLIVY